MDNLPSDYFDDDLDVHDEEITDEDIAAEECGRWLNGKLGQFCSKAGSEECDWVCPLRTERADR